MEEQRIKKQPGNSKKTKTKTKTGTTTKKTGTAKKNNPGAAALLQTPPIFFQGNSFGWKFSGGILPTPGGPWRGETSPKSLSWLGIGEFPLGMGAGQRQLGSAGPGGWRGFVPGRRKVIWGGLGWIRARLEAILGTNPIRDSAGIKTLRHRSPGWNLGWKLWKKSLFFFFL